MMITETAAGTVLANGGGKIRRTSFKSRGGPVARNNSGGGGGGGSARGYRAVRVTVPSTVVAELASKFNAVVVDADRGATARDIIKKVNKTLANGAAVRATVEKFESAAEKKPGGGGGGGDHVVVVRTNSSEQRSSATAAAVAAASIVKRRMEQFQNGKKPTKPSVLGPKPKVAEATKRRSGEERRQALQKDSVAATADYRRLLNKHKRLSIARDPDAQLESVLNATPEQPSPAVTAEPAKPDLAETAKPDLAEPAKPNLAETAKPDLAEPAKPDLAEPAKPDLAEPVQGRRTPSPPKLRPKPNSSFLHGRRRPETVAAVPAMVTPQSSPVTAEPAEPDHLHTGPTEDEPELVEVDPVEPEDDEPRNSFLHSYKKKLTADCGDDYNYIDGSGQQPQAIYEELLCDVQMPDQLPLPDVVVECSLYDGANDHHYTTIDGGEQNIYDDVVTAAAPENRKRPAAPVDEDGSYETVQAPPPPLPPTPLQVAAAAATTAQVFPAHDGDDHLLQYGLLDKKPTASDNFSLEIDNSIYGLHPPSESTSSGITSDSVSADRNSKFDLDEEWVDVDNTSDELQEIIVFRQKPKMNDTTTKGWSLQVRKQLTKAYVSISSQSVISFVKDVPDQFIFKTNKCDYLDEQLLSVVLKTVFLEEKFESQELSLFFDNEIKENSNTIGGQEIPEEIYADYDSFESDDDDSWDDCKDGVKVKRVPYPCENRDLPAPPSQQNIYGLVPLVLRAGNRMKKRWSLGALGLNRIRKFSVGHLTTDFGNRTYGSTTDKSTDNKIFNPSAKCNSLSSSIFYLNDPTYNNVENGQIRAPVRNASKPPSSVDSRRLSVARPSSPPPPPPPVKRHSTGSNAYDYSLTRSISNSKGRPMMLDTKSNTVETVSENGSNHGSDLYMRFADEPLYQFYAADISERTKSVFAGDMMEECDGYEEISSITSRPSALELITPCPTGHGQHRSLWCEVPEVKNSGIIDTLKKPRERKLQEAKFELITSEASYFKSLTVLEKHFVNSHSMNDETILSKTDRKILFGNVNPVRKCSEKLLAALEKCWQDNILLQGLCEILHTHSKENFDIFVKYCSNQIYIDRTLKSLREKNFKFNEALHRLESDTKCQSLSLHSFLMLPMQRITRLPLLVDAILSLMDSTENSPEYQMCELTLASLNSIVQNCNESTRKLERYEEMLMLSRQLEFSSKREMKAMSVASSSRWLVRSGSMLHLTSPDAKLTFSRKLIRPTKLYFFLFNDMFFIAKRKSDESYTVVDYCARNFVQMVDATELVITSSYKNLLMLTILENHEAKTVEMLLSCDSESSKKRWIEAMSPPISSNPDETLYNEWDCPQVFSEHPYIAVQPDELSLQSGDIVKVLTKMNDGWYHGERIRDGEKGWFPGNYTSEIASQHARAKNLKQRYRLLAMSGNYLQSQQDKIKKK